MGNKLVSDKVSWKITGYIVTYHKECVYTVCNILAKNVKYIFFDTGNFLFQLGG